MTQRDKNNFNDGPYHWQEILVYRNGVNILGPDQEDTEILELGGEEESVTHEIEDIVFRLQDYMESFYVWGNDPRTEFINTVVEFVRDAYQSGYGDGHYDAVSSIMNGVDVSDTGEVGQL